jgi:N-acetylglucosamine-6-phosphate deacetylase
MNRMPESLWMAFMQTSFPFGLPIRAKTKRKILLVTDAMALVGAKDTGFRLGDYDIKVHEGRRDTADAC